MSRLYLYFILFCTLILYIGCQQDEAERDADSTRIPSSLIPGVEYSIDDDDPEPVDIVAGTMGIKLPEDSLYSLDDLTFIHPDGELTREKNIIDLDSLRLPNNLPVVIAAIDNSGYPLMLSLAGVDNLNEISAKSTAFTLVYLWYSIVQYNPDKVESPFDLLSDCFQADELAKVIETGIQNGENVLADPTNDLIYRYPLAINAIRNMMLDQIQVEPDISTEPIEYIEQFEINDFTFVLNSEHNKNSGVELSVSNVDAESTDISWNVKCDFTLINNGDRTVTVAVIPVDANDSVDFNNAQIMLIPPSDYPVEISSRNRDMFKDDLQADISLGSLEFSYNFGSDKKPAAMIYILGDGKNTYRRFFEQPDEQTLLRAAVIRGFAYDRLFPTLASFMGKSIDRESASCLRTLFDSLADNTSITLQADYRLGIESYRYLLASLNDFISVDPCYKSIMKDSPQGMSKTLEALFNIHSKIAAGVNLSIAKPPPDALDNFSYLSIKIIGDAVERIIVEEIDGEEITEIEDLELEPEQEDADEPDEPID